MSTTFKPSTTQRRTSTLVLCRSTNPISVSLPKNLCRRKKVSFNLEPVKILYTKYNNHHDEEPSEIILKKCEELKELKFILTMNREVKPKCTFASSQANKMSLNTALDSLNDP